MDGEERRVDRFPGQPLRRQSARRAVEFEQVNALALAVRVGPHVHAGLSGAGGLSAQGIHNGQREEERTEDVRTATHGRVPGVLKREVANERQGYRVSSS